MTTDHSPAFVDRVRTYYLECAPNCSMPTHATSMQEAADGVIIIDDNDGEFSVFFDLDHWQFRHPELWEKPLGTTVSPDFARLGSGVLEGCGLTFKGSFEIAFEYAKSHLVSAVEHWHEALKPIEFNPPWAATG